MCLRNLFKCFEKSKSKPTTKKRVSRQVTSDLLPSTIGYLSLISSSITSIEYDCKHYNIPLSRDTIDELYDFVLSIEKKVNLEKEKKESNHMTE